LLGIYIEGAIPQREEMSVSSILRTICEAVPDCKVIHTYQGNRFSNMFGVDEDRTIFYDIRHIQEIGWKKQYKLAKNLLKENDIDKLLIYKSVIMTGCRVGDLSQIKRFIKRRKQDDFVYMKHAMSRTQYCRYLMVEAAAFVCKNVYQFMVDTQEPRWGELFDCNYGYLFISNKDNLRYMPCFEYGVQKYVESYDKTKDLDFVFYCTCLTSDRDYIYNSKEVLESIDKSMIGIKTQKEKPIKQSEYYGLIARSRYTICVPGYDTTMFSTMRFVESISLDCLCFVHSSCKLDDVRNTFPDICDIIERCLVVDFDEIQDKICELTEDERSDIIKEIKNTKSWKRFSDIEYISKRWCKL